LVPVAAAAAAAAVAAVRIWKAMYGVLFRFLVWNMVRASSSSSKQQQQRQQAHCRFKGA
jgi:hypothetical protein